MTVAENLQDVLTGANIKCWKGNRLSPRPREQHPQPDSRFGKAAVNLPTNPVLDPVGKIPEYKVCTAKVEAAQCLH